MVADACAVLGLVLLAGGLACWSIPLAMVVVGALLLAAGLWSHYSRAGRERAASAQEPPQEADSTERGN